jgi:hypothetical protein
VRTKGIITTTLSKPISRAPAPMARHSKAKPSRYCVAVVARRAAEAEHRVLLLRLELRAADSSAYSLVLKSLMRTITGFGYWDAAMVAMPRAKLSTKYSVLSSYPA